MEIVEAFAGYSGINLNKQKTFLMVGSIEENLATFWENELNIKLAPLLVKYLGLPLCSNRLTRKDYVPLLEKITDRIILWQSRLLYFAGRLELIKSVLMAFCIFWLSAFVLQKPFSIR